MKQIIIGREGNQPFAITDGYVSRQHALFVYDERTGMMTLTDQSSSGTWVQMGQHFQQIKQCNVNAKTVVRLGPYFTFTIGQLFQSKILDPPPKRVDISSLRWVAENYEKTKLELDQKQASVNSMRSFTLVGTILGGGITALIPKMLGQKDPEWYLYAIGPVIAVAAIVLLINYLNRASKEIVIKKSQNEKNYKITFCCPKCHVPFTNMLYENILAGGKCPKCKTEFYDSKT